MFYQFGQQHNLRGGSTERGLHEVIKGGVNGASGVPQGPPGPFGIAPTGGNGGISVLFRGPVAPPAWQFPRQSACCHPSL